MDIAILAKMACSSQGSIPDVFRATRNEVRLWDLVMGTPMHVIADLARRVDGIAVSPDGSSLAVAAGGIGALYDVQSGERRAAFGGGSGEDGWMVRSVAFSPDGKKLAFGCNGGRIELRNVASGEIEKVWTVGRDEVMPVRFLADGKSVASASWSSGDKPLITIWDIETDKERTSFEIDEEIEYRRLSLSPDGQTVVSVHNDYNDNEREVLTVWSVEAGEAKHEMRKHDLNEVSFAPDGRTFAVPAGSGQVFLVPIPPDAADLGLALPMASFGGDWDVPAGPLTIKVRDNSVIGSFRSYNGRIEGELSEDRTTVTGRWVQQNGVSGGFVLKMSADGKTIEGSRWIGDERHAARKNAWSGKRIEE